MGEPPSNSGYMCWMCKFYPIAENERVPPPDMFRYCFMTNGQRRAMRQSCPHGSLDRERLSRVKGKREPKGLRDEANKTPLSEGQESSIEEAYMRCLKTATDRGLVILSRAKLTKKEAEILIDKGLIERRTYGSVSRLFIRSVTTKRLGHFGE